MAAASVSFEDWLGERLTSLNPEVDTEVFVTYITGILETETDEEDTRESILGILGEVLVEEKETVCDEIVQRWNQEHSKQAKAETDTSTLATQLSEILENQKIESVKPKEKSADEIARKEAILAQYGAVSDGETDDDEDPGGGNAGKLEKNDNAEAVTRAVQEQREQSKQEYEKKKEKDKQDREQQKQKEKDRKETEKKRTQKGERRR